MMTLPRNMIQKLDAMGSVAKFCLLESHQIIWHNKRLDVLIAIALDAVGVSSKHMLLEVHDALVSTPEIRPMIGYV